MTGKQKKLLIIGAIIFIAYIFVAARPVPVETILSPKWFISLETNYPTASPSENMTLTPFFLGSRPGGHFGFVDREGILTVNRTLRENTEVSISDEYWAEYDLVPRNIDVRTPLNRSVMRIEDPQGYPMFLDNRTFLIGSAQNSISAIDSNGRVSWSYDFASIITTIDAANGLVLAGLLDGTVEIINNEGRRVFFFEPGGSRHSVIYGCAISEDGSIISIVSGIDLQRFLVLERHNASSAEAFDYRVIYHEFLEEGFRRPVHVSFIDSGNRIIFERQGALGIYDIRSRRSIKIPLEGEIAAAESLGSNRLFFLVTSQGDSRKNLVAIRLPGTVILSAPFRSRYTFLGRQDSTIIVGGGMTLAAFELEQR